MASLTGGVLCTFARDLTGKADCSLRQKLEGAGLTCVREQEKTKNEIQKTPQHSKDTDSNCFFGHFAKHLVRKNATP